MIKVFRIEETNIGKTRLKVNIASYDSQSLIMDNAKIMVIKNYDKPFQQYVRYIKKYIYCRNSKDNTLSLQKIDRNNNGLIGMVKRKQYFVTIVLQIIKKTKRDRGIMSNTGQYVIRATAISQ